MTQPRPTDSQRAANWSIQATQEGRYELAESLLRIAIQAYRAEKRAVNVPLVGATRFEQPSALKVVQEVTGNGAADLARAETSILAAVQDRVAAVQDRAQRPDPRRCEAKVVRDGIADVCRGVVYWSAERNQWDHVHPELDSDHYASAPSDGGSRPRE